MELSWFEIKKLKGKTIKHKETGELFPVKSVTTRFIRFGRNGGIKMFTHIFHDTEQKKYELVIEN